MNAHSCITLKPYDEALQVLADYTLKATRENLKYCHPDELLYLEPDGQALDLNEQLLLDGVGLVLKVADLGVGVGAQLAQLVLELNDPAIRIMSFKSK